MPNARQVSLLNIVKDAEVAHREAWRLNIDVEEIRYRFALQRLLGQNQIDRIDEMKPN